LSNRPHFVTFTSLGRKKSWRSVQRNKNKEDKFCAKRSGRIFLDKRNLSRRILSLKERQQKSGSVSPQILHTILGGFWNKSSLFLASKERQQKVIVHVKASCQDSVSKHLVKFPGTNPAPLPQKKGNWSLSQRHCQGFGSSFSPPTKNLGKTRYCELFPYVIDAFVWNFYRPKLILKVQMRILFPSV